MLKITLTVHYDLNGETLENLTRLVNEEIYRAIGNGLLNYESVAQVDDWYCTIEQVEK